MPDTRLVRPAQRTTWFRALLLLTTSTTAIACAPHIVLAQEASQGTTATTLPAPGSTAATPKTKAGRSGAGSNDEAVIVTGTRSFNKKARDSTSPIDVVSASTLRRSGQPNLADALTRTLPSITIKAMGNDTAALVSAIRLRGLNPNDVLVLVDGKRRHMSSNFSADAGPEQGSTPVDLNAIPASAIDHIEVLRDGAAAQYGSDAIAGVVNIILKKTDHGGSSTAFTGANAYNGDGWTYQLDQDAGFSFGNDGYVHISGQMYHADHSVQPATDDRTGTDVNHILSSPEETRESLALTFGDTLSQDLFGGIDGYGNVSYMHRHSEAYENYRLPSKLPALYPDGFSPLETNEENDFASTIGVKAPDVFGFHTDVSTTYGEDHTNIGNKDTGNPTLYADTGYSPTSVTAQTQTTAQWTNNLDFTRPFTAWNKPMTFAFGAEERVDTYRLGAGDYASYADGGTQGFAGLLPSNAGAWSRDVWSVYADYDAHPLKHWDVDVAGRFEHYTDFGNTYNGKISTRYDFTSNLALRGTISNGTRAPTLAEEHYSSLNVSPTGASGILAADSTAARSIGAESLRPEYSTNASVGVVYSPLHNLNITADIYQINIRDRITGAGDVSGAAAITAIENSGATLPEGITTADVSAYYLANAASTRTQGLDLTATYLTDLSYRGLGTITWTAGLDLNRTRVTHINADSTGAADINAQGVSYLTTASPRSKLVLNAFWKRGVWDVNLRQTRYGETTSLLEYEDQAPAALRYSSTQFYEFKNTPRWLTDLEVGRQLNARWHVAIGADDIFNVRPRKVPADTAYLGVQYYATTASQVPISGGFYYGRVNYNF